MTGPGEVDAHVLRLRDRDNHMPPQLQRATRPERVLHYRRCSLHRNSQITCLLDCELCPRLQGCCG